MVWYKKNRLTVILLAGLSLLICTQDGAFAQNSTDFQMPEPRFGMCSARLGDRLFLIGGAQRAQSLQGISQGIKGVTDIVSVYDFKNGQWSTAASLETPRVFATAVTLNDSIYVMGGMDDEGNPLRSTEVYDPTNNEWHESAPMLKYRVGAASVVYGDSILVFGGGGTNSPMLMGGSTAGRLGELHRLVEAYSPSTGNWIALPDSIYLGRAFHKVVKIGSSIYILGGLGATFGPLSLIERYIPGRGTVDKRFTLSNGRYFFELVVLRDSVYAISGLSGGQYYLQSFYPGVSAMSLGSDGEESEPEDRSQLVHARASFVAAVGPDSSIYLFGGLSPTYNSGQVPDPTVSRISVLPTTAIEMPSAIPLTFDLKQNYPNPFNPTTTIQFEVPAPGMKLNLIVYNLLGERVATLVSGYYPPGLHSAVFNGANFPSGVYIYMLSNENGSVYRKMVLIK